MTFSLPLRLNLIGLAFTTTLSLIIIGIGGGMMYRQQRHDAVFRAEYAANELANRAERLLNLQMKFQDFLGFEEQCTEVIANDPLLNTAALFDPAGLQLFTSGRQDMTHLSDAVAAAAGNTATLRAGSDWFVVHPVEVVSGQAEGYTVVLIDNRTYSEAVFKPLLILVMVSFLFCLAAVMVQQVLFRVTVGRPLARLVQTADTLHSADPERIALLERNATDDDIGHIYGALKRLMSRLYEANTRLVEQNSELDRMVKQRTMELQETNDRLAQDIERRKALEEELRVMAGTDILTRLPNRSSLSERLNLALYEAKRHTWHIAVFFIDLDHFKVVNDTQGHQAGDRLLVEISRRLVSTVRRSDTVARLGGDEFMVILSDIASPSNAGVVAGKILKALQEPVVLDDMKLHISASIGISMAPEDSMDARTLMKNADTAMYHAKSSGRNNFQFFDSSMLEKVQRRLGIETRLRSALENNEFLLHYQPQFLADTRQISGVEALLRWRSPDGELIPPGRFIGIAEETGLIIPIGLWVLEEACRQMVLWEAGGLDVRRMAVNLSPRQFGSPALPENVIDILARTGLTPSRLQLEITETCLMHKPDEAIRVLETFRGMGIELSIDDFGTGYSSFSYLRFLPVHHLKIDRSFISRIEENTNDARITESIITLAAGLDLGVIAEGVETSGQLDLLRRQGCREVQGFLFSEPLPPQDFAARFADIVRKQSPAAPVRTARDPRSGSQEVEDFRSV